MKGGKILWGGEEKKKKKKKGGEKNQTKQKWKSLWENKSELEKTKQKQKKNPEYFFLL